MGYISALFVHHGFIHVVTSIVVYVLLAHEGIEECGFAHIMSSNNSEKDPLLRQLFV